MPAPRIFLMGRMFSRRFIIFASMRKLENHELGRPTQEEFFEMRKFPVVVVADNVRSLHNVGSMFRTCDAFAVEALYLCGITATPPDKEIHKTALGAEQTVAWRHFLKTSDAVDLLQSEGYTVLAVEQAEGAAMLDAFRIDPERKYALVFGNEVRGVDQQVVDRCAGCLEIPQAGTKHSLNVSVSAGVVLWAFFRQFGL